MRQLESEVRMLKDLLDGKEEQLEMVSRIHSFSPYSPPPSGTSTGPHRANNVATRGSPVAETPSSLANTEEQDDCFTIQESAFLVNDGTGSFYLGGSSGVPFVGMANFHLLLKHLLINPCRFLQAKLAREWSPKARC